jgi:drug/metabolite transporter (DMT)-like permease
VVIVAARGEISVLRDLAFNIGDVWMVIACAAYAVYTLQLRDRPKVAGFTFFTVVALAALVISLPLFAYEVASGQVIWPDARGWAILLYVTLLPSLVSQIFFIRGVELIGPSRAGLFVNLVPVFGALLAVVLLGEPSRSTTRSRWRWCSGDLAVGAAAGAMSPFPSSARRDRR